MASGLSTLMILTMISIGLGIMGYSSYGATVLSGFPFPNMGFINAIIVGIGGILVVGLVVGAVNSNFALIYSVPGLIFSTVMLAFFVAPLNFLSDPAMPTEIKAVLGGVFGVMIFMTYMAFLRGGEV